MASEEPLAIIYTEGKTDWKHLKKAQEKLNIDLPIIFDESEESLGASKLLAMCEFLSMQEDDKLPGICIFDTDLDKKTLKKVKEENANYKPWKNKFYSFILSIQRREVLHLHRI